MNITHNFYNFRLLDSDSEFFFTTDIHGLARTETDDGWQRTDIAD
jgi:hypothetical protein